MAVFTTSLSLIFFFICTPHQSQIRAAKCNMTAKMIEAGIIPKVLTQGPEQSLQVFLPNHTESVDPGAMLLHEDAIAVPKFVYEAPADSWNSLFIVAKLNWDPEQKVASRSYNVTPGLPSKTEWHQLVLLNIPGTDYTKGKTILDYDPPHHDMDLEIIDLFLYLVYRQPKKFPIHRRTRMITFKSNIGNTTVLGSLNDYIAHYNLTGPIAGNFLYRRWPYPTGVKGPRLHFVLDPKTVLSYENLETKEEDKEKK